METYSNIQPHNSLEMAYSHCINSVVVGWSKELTGIFVVMVPIGGDLGAAGTLLPVLLHPRRFLLRPTTAKYISQICSLCFQVPPQTSHFSWEAPAASWVFVVSYRVLQLQLQCLKLWTTILRSETPVVIQTTPHHAKLYANVKVAVKDEHILLRMPG